MKYKKLKVDLKTPLKDQLKELGIESFMDLDKIENLHEPEAEIYDVEDGKETLGKSPDECESIFKEQKRIGLTLVEVLALIRKNSKILKSHNLDCTGSRCYSTDGVPYVCLVGGRPKLYWGYVGRSLSLWGSPSCGSNGALSLMFTDIFIMQTIDDTKKI